MVKRYRLEREQLIAAPRPQVFEFFAKAENLERLTPPFLRFAILTPLPIEMKRGRFIEYRIGLGGVPMTWLTEISDWQPPRLFVDEQLRGPYRYWHHTHEFREVGGSTSMHDLVEYELPLGALGQLAHAVLVHKLLGRIFDYREQAVRAAFPGAR
ncbi:MAG TPA: SRPBCC family protein [Polyangiaceae bacterium]|nr:SRPBCC family protein [Polyangiaceae bacterium]